MAIQKENQKLGFNTDYRLLQVESIAEGEHSVILSTSIKLPFSIKTLVLPILSEPLRQGLL